MLGLKTLALGAAVGILLAPFGAGAATTVGAPTPGQGNCFPFGCNANTSPTGQDIDYEQIYSSAAFSGATTFDTLTFKDSGLNFLKYLPTGTVASGDLIAGNYDISFFTTTAPLGSVFPIAPEANRSTFFLGHLDDLASFTGFSIGGSTYTYDPSQGNLVIEVKAFDQAVTPNSGSNSYLAVDKSGLVTTRSYFETNGAPVYNTDNTGLVTTFSVGPVAAVPEASTWFLMIAGVAGIGLSLRRSRISRLASAVTA